MLLALTGLTFCVKVEDSGTGTVTPSVTAAIFPPSVSCTGAIVFFNIPGYSGTTVSDAGVCWATTTSPTTLDKKGFTEEVNMYLGRFRSEIDGLQPATLYHVRAYFTANSVPLYSEDISFTTNPKPVITTTGVTDIAGTTAKITGNLMSTGGSFVVARGICYSTAPDPESYGTNPYIEEEVQSVNGDGEFSLTLTNLNPGTQYFVKVFVAVMTGIYYGDQLVEYGNEVTFTTGPGSE